MTNTFIQGDTLQANVDICWGMCGYVSDISLHPTLPNRHSTPQPSLWKPTKPCVIIMLTTVNWEGCKLNRDRLNGNDTKYTPQDKSETLSSRLRRVVSTIYRIVSRRSSR